MDDYTKQDEAYRAYQKGFADGVKSVTDNNVGDKSTRAKLVELIAGGVPKNEIFMYKIFEGIADLLVANGVTFSRCIRDCKNCWKWIPVSERLPEDGETVLVYGSKGGIYTAWCNRRYQNVGWHKLNSKSHYCNPTHWMPLPEPPKGE